MQRVRRCNDGWGGDATGQRISPEGDEGLVFGGDLVGVADILEGAPAAHVARWGMWAERGDFDGVFRMNDDFAAEQFGCQHNGLLLVRVCLV